MTRAEPRAAFLAAAGWNRAEALPLAGDASARRYERLAHANGSTAVLMDAPPGAGVDTRPFVRIAEHLAALGLSPPRIHAHDHANGFLLIEDLGDGLFSRLLDADPNREQELYTAAVEVLLALHAHPPPPDVAPISPAHLAGGGDLALGFYAPCGGRPTGRAAFARLRDLLGDALAETAADRPVLSLRDYHAENLLWLPDRTGVARVGLLDFQDAFAGHPAYDLVSLLEDARRDVSPALRDAMLAHYAARSGGDAASLSAAFAALGAQRNLRILGVFARLSGPLGKPRYAGFIPRVWRYLQNDLAHPALAPLAEFLADVLPEPTAQRLQTLCRRSTDSQPAAAMVFAAGLGTRMRPLTEHKPKPLIEVATATLLDRALDLAAEAQVPRRVVNTHYLGDQIAAHLAARPDIAISHESPRVLETGGGLKRALPLLGSGPVFTLNTDAIWTGPNPFRQLAEVWDPARMDALLLLVAPGAARGHGGEGDFLVAADGRLSRGPGGIYTGAQILNPAGLAEIADPVFSLNRLWDRMLARGRLFGTWHRGGWCDVGRPESIALAEALLAEAPDG